MQTDHDLPPPRPRKLRRFLIGVAVVLGLLVLGYLWAAYRPTGYARERRAVEARVAAARPPEVRRPGERTVEPSGAVPSDPWQEVRAAFEKLPEPGRQYLQEAALGGRHFTAWSVQPEESAGAGGIAVGGRVYTRESVVAGILRSAAHLLDRWPAAGGEAEQAFAGMVLGTMREHGPPPCPTMRG